ncbi:unnamed protein product, partial [Mesorhabditis belari]|uniref:S-formylglutathione hydrolase n=1 Tax=Mesorhabditis belari TaxID=2138241 RepID=A0AAF3FBC0_9BILA
MARNFFLGPILASKTGSIPQEIYDVMLSDSANIYFWAFTGRADLAHVYIIGGWAIVIGISFYVLIMTYCEIELISSWRSFNGYQKVYKHQSHENQCEMTFGVYLPCATHHTGPRPTLFFLSGITATHANFIEKFGPQRLADKYGFIIINPDTSPRGDDVPDMDGPDFGKGAGFYLDATEEPWSKNYRMYSYVTKELLDINFPIDEEKIGIFGFSMGGHGAITIGLKHPEIFKSISAFAPVCHPAKSFFGRRLFARYLGTDEATWADYDSSMLAARYTGPKRVIRVDIGAIDPFLVKKELQPESIQNNEHLEVDYHCQPDYDHSHWFVASFIEKHFEHHAKELGV